jgi:beta-lactamase regulating signal transducer with metallopeptidase domain
MTSATSFLISIADAGARSLLLAGAVGCGLWILRVRNVVAQKAAWILVLAAGMAMPVVARWATHLSWLPERDTFVITARGWTSTTVRDHAQPVTMSANVYIRREADTATQAPIAPEPAAADYSEGSNRFPAPTIAHTSDETSAEAPAPASVSWLDRARAGIAWMQPARAALLLYLLVALALLLRLGLGAWSAARLWRRAEPISLDGLATGIRVRSSRAIASPVTVGGGVVLPADYASWDPEKLGIVLAHEGSHVRQRDFTLQLATSLYIALFWFSPLGWWLKRKLSDLGETISDGAAVHQAASHASYAQVLLEFAALPRPVTIGVAMAHRGHLRSRIDHLLNESSFRQAFSGGRARLAAAILLVPVALFAATAMVRVHAAGQQVPPAQATEPNPAQTPQAAPEPAAAPQAVPATPSAPAPPSGADVIPQEAPVAPPPPPDNDMTILTAPGQGGQYFFPKNIAIPNAKLLAKNAHALAMLKMQQARLMALDGKAYRFGFGFDREPYAIVNRTANNGTHTSASSYNGTADGFKTEIDKAKNVAHGDFIWFQRDGKSYVIDDPAILAEIKPMQDKMDALGKQQEALGKQQEELGKQQEALGKQMEQIKVPTPDMQKEIAKLQAVQAKLAALQGKDATVEQLAEIQNELGDIQGRLGGLQGDMGGRMGDLGGKMGELGGQQGKLGAEQGRLGAQQGRLAREMDGKVLTIIDESLKNGKARQVQ